MHSINDLGQLQPTAPGAPPGSAPSLAWLALNRLGYGPRSGDLDAFNALPGATPESKFRAYVDLQLSPETIDDSACEAYVNGLDRADTQTPPTTLPPLNATAAQLSLYSADRFVNYDLQKYLWTAAYARGALSKRQLFEVLVDFWSITSTPPSRAFTSIGRIITSSAATRWATSAICWAPAPRAPRCCAS